MKKHLIALSTLLSAVAFQANAGSLYDIATACTWTFGRVQDGSIISTTLKLSPTGRITGYSYPNEYSWEINDGALLFRHQDGRVSTRFTSATVNTYTGQITLMGAFLLAPGLTHSLTCHH